MGPPSGSPVIGIDGKRSAIRQYCRTQSLRLQCRRAGVGVEVGAAISGPSRFCKQIGSALESGDPGIALIQSLCLGVGIDALPDEHGAPIRLRVGERDVTYQQKREQPTQGPVHAGDPRIWSATARARVLSDGSTREAWPPSGA